MMNTRIAQENHTMHKECTCNGEDRCGGGDGCGDENRSSKMLKQKKAPQRGLGVAQLEKIRLEDQQNKDNVVSQPQACTIFPPSSEIMSPPTNIFSSRLDVQCPNFKSSNNYPSQDPALNSLPTISPSVISSTNYLFKPSPSMPNVDDLCSNQMTFRNSLSSNGGFDGSWPKFLNDGFNLDNQKVDLDGDLVNQELNNPLLHFPNLMQISMKSQQPHPSSKMESPWNQSYFGNKYSPLWQEEEEKMVGFKRKFPFPMEIPPALVIHGKLPSSFVDGSHESTSGNKGSPATNPKPRNPTTRQPSSSSFQAEKNPRKIFQENVDFLTLAPPLAAAPSLDVKGESPLDNSANLERDLQNGSQEVLEDRSRWARTSGSSILKGKQFFSFVPSPNLGSCDSEVGERVDLSLKL